MLSFITIVSLLGAVGAMVAEHTPESVITKLFMDEQEREIISK
jgi:hypothetical protein